MVVEAADGQVCLLMHAGFGHARDVEPHTACTLHAAGRRPSKGAPAAMNDPPMLDGHPSLPPPTPSQAAYEIYKRSGPATFSLVLMDCRMPVMDGWQVGRTPKALHPIPDPAQPS